MTFDVQKAREEAARAAHDNRCGFHRDGLPLIGHWGLIDTCTEDARAAMAVIVPAVLAEIRAMAGQWVDDVRLLAAEGLAEQAACTWIDADALFRLCDEIDAAVRGEQP